MAGADGVDLFPLQTQPRRVASRPLVIGSALLWSEITMYS